MLSAEKFRQSSSISGPVATEKPRSEKISASSSITWLTGWTLPKATGSIGRLMSSVSVASRRSTSAASSASLRAAIASVTASRKAWMRGPSLWRCSGVMPPSVFKSWVTAPCLPIAAPRAAASAARSAASPMRPSQSDCICSRSTASLAMARPLHVFPRRLKPSRAARAMGEPRSAWPPLSADRDGATIATLHLFSQVIGKVPTALLPWRNHGWHLTLHLGPRGLRTEPIHAAAGTFELGLDLVGGEAVLEQVGERRRLPLAGTSVAAFYQAVKAMLAQA